MTLRYLSLCSGIEAASVAWHPLGWRPVAFAEIDAFPSAALAHHYPGVPNWGDMTRFTEWPDATFDLLVGGTPCQSFSIAGMRAGLNDPRGNLMLTFAAVARRYRPAWVVWENVPGVLSSERGRDYGSFVKLMGECGYFGAWRVLDAQYFGVAQRRRRVFFVGHARDWRRAAAVLLERESMRGNPAPRRETRESVARPIAAGSARSSGYRNDADTADNLIAFGGNNTSGPIDVAAGLNAKSTLRGDFESETFVCGALNSAGGHAYPGQTVQDACAGLLVPVAFKASHFTRGKDGAPSELAPPLSADADKGDQDTLIAFAQNQREELRELHAAGALSSIRRGDAKNETLIAFNMRGREAGNVPEVDGDGLANVRAASGGSTRTMIAFADCADPIAANQARTYTREGAHNFRMANVAHTAMSVRRLTPRECERLQGFPDDYTLIPYRGKPAADGPRYKALGNSMAVPVMRWIGERIAAVHAATEDAAA